MLTACTFKSATAESCHKLACYGLVHRLIEVQ